MDSEEQNQSCSNSSRSSKKQKQKKIPQRGLGVAQLEKIRIEEQQKIASNAIFAYPSMLSPNSSSSLPVSLFNYPSSQSPPPSQNPILRPFPSMSNDENSCLNSISAPRGFNVAWPSVPTIDDNMNLHKMWKPYEFNHEGDHSSWDHGMPRCPSMSLPFPGSPIMPRPHQFSQASASSLMNIPLLSSPLSSNFQLEPPSNQSSYSNLSSLWPEEDKASTKRPYPFPLDMPALPSFQHKLPRIASTSAESTPFGNISLLNANLAVPVLRETPMMPSSSTTEPTQKKSNKERSGNQNGNFLTLGPPSVTFPHPSSRLMYSPAHRITEDPVANSPRSAGLNYQQPFFSFFPASKAQQESSSSLSMNNHTNYNGNSEVGVIVDLNLKL